jgi:hypothetical protein
MAVFKLISKLPNLSTMIPRNKRGAVTIALGQEGLLALRQAAKQTKTKPAAVAKALIFSGIDSVLSGELKIETKPRLTK